MHQLLVLCPLESEMRLLLAAFADLGLDIASEKGLRLQIFRIPSKAMIISRGGHGKTQFGIHTQYLLTHLENVNGVVCAGAGGGLATHLKIGDLVIAEKTIEHDYTERFDPNAKLPEFPAHQSLLNRFKKRSFEFSFDVHFGSVAGGDEDIVESDRAKELHSRTGSLAVAWEGTGGARASLFNDLPYLEIRAITDNARESASESFSKNLGSCMKNVASLLHEVF